MASSSFDTTSSYPISLQTPQSNWELQLSQIIAALGQQQLNWAQGVFGQTSQITDQMINNYMANSQAGMGLAANNIDRYENLFQPQENALIQDANTYASTPRIQENMGAAESATGQAMDQGRINAENTLRSYGIDPSSGRYQELETAQRAGAAAAQAGAGQQAELATEATGRQLRNEAIQVGQQYPGQAVNALNSSLQGIAGAENAALGNANTGANLMHVADPYFQSAMNLRYPPTGQVSSGMRTSNSSDPSSGSRSNSSGSGSGQPTGLGPNGGGGGGGGGEGGGYPDTTNDFGDPSTSGMSAGGGAWRGGSLAGFSPAGGGAGTDSSGGNFDSTSPDPWMYGGSPNAYPDNSPNFNNSTPFDSSLNSGSATDPFANASNFNAYDPYSAYGGASSTEPNFSANAYSGVSDPFNNYSGDFSNATSFGDVNAPSYDTSGGGGGASSASYDDTGSYYDDSDSGGYAQGGGVLPGATTGGHVPRSASPSGGRQTDDIPARLNAEEFVIPRDVARWKGQEYFQKLIEDSRRKRLGAPAKGKPKPALGGRPRFVSQHMGAR